MVGAVAAATSTDLVAAATTPTGSLLYRSTDGGGTWATERDFADGGAGLFFLQFESSSLGAVLEGGRGPSPMNVDNLWLTRDGGATWACAQF